MNSSIIISKDVSDTLAKICYINLKKYQRHVSKKEVLEEMIILYQNDMAFQKSVDECMTKTSSKLLSADIKKSLFVIDPKLKTYLYEIKYTKNVKLIKIIYCMVQEYMKILEKEQ